MLDKTATILTRVVLTEKAPFWVDTFYESGNYCGTYLVKAFVSEDEKPDNINFGDIDAFDCYVIIKEEREIKKCKNLFAIKKYCKRKNK